MRTNWAIILFLIFFSFRLSAQLSTADKVLVDEHIALAERKNDALEYYEAGYIYSRGKLYEKAIELYKKGLNISNSKYNSRVLCNALGNCYYEQSLLADAVLYYKQALEYTMQGSSPEKHAIGTADKIGQIYMQIGKPKEALEYYMFSLNFAIQIQNRDKTDKSLENLSKCYASLENSADAKKFRSLIGLPFDQIVAKINQGVPPDEQSIKLKEIQHQYLNLREENTKIHSAYDSTLRDNTSLRAERKALEDTLLMRQAYLSEIEINLSEKEEQLNALEHLLQNRELALTVAMGIAAVILLLTFFVFRSYRIKRRQHRMLEIQNYEIEVQSHKLNESNAELHATLENLRSTQSQLVQSEKMASLGQLIAGIAHELNTPLGAIKSSIGTVRDSSAKTIVLLPSLIQKLETKQLNLFLEMINEGSKNTSHYTSREERTIKRKIASELENDNIDKNDEIAETLVDIGVHDNFDKYIELFKNEHLDLILQTAYFLAVQTKNSENIKTAVDRAAKIIYALKSYSHTGNSEEKVIANITEGLNTVLTIYHNQLKQGIIIEKEFEELPEVSCFPDQLNQVWTNLIHNSIQAMSGKGTLTFKTQKSGNFVIVSVKDSGTGIPEEIRSRVFEPFFTTKAAGEGTGLGLDIVKKIVERHEGELYFDSEIGKGTTFYVKLPLS